MVGIHVIISTITIIIFGYNYNWILFCIACNVDELFIIYYYFIYYLLLFIIYLMWMNYYYNVDELFERAKSC